MTSAEVEVWFRFTESDLANLACSGSTGFEVDAVIYGIGFRDKVFGPSADSESWNSNLPGAFLDTEATDSTGLRVLSVGTRALDQLQPNVLYYTRVNKVGSGGPTGIHINAQRTDDPSNPVELGACMVFGEAWCGYDGRHLILTPLIGASAGATGSWGEPLGPYPIA